jgi:hypothetical protein
LWRGGLGHKVDSLFTDRWDERRKGMERGKEGRITTDAEAVAEAYGKMKAAKTLGNFYSREKDGFR